MISQTWIIGKAIRALFADRVTYTQLDTHDTHTHTHATLTLLMFVCYYDGSSLDDEHTTPDNYKSLVPVFPWRCIEAAD